MNLRNKCRLVYDKYRYVSLFVFIVFMLPLISVVVQSISTNALLNFVLYGIEAASPTIAAVIALSISRTCKKFAVKYFHSKNLLMAVVLPAIIACLTMFLAKLIFCLIVKTDFTAGSVSDVQFIIVLWALIAEEIGWRGYLPHFLYEHMKMPCLVPAIVGVVWCLWHYHYFMLGGMDIPVVFFSSCIVESYIYAYLLDLTENNLISAMIYHFAWNLFIHIFAINPTDNRGNSLPYIILVVLEIVIGLLLSLAVKKKGLKKFKEYQMYAMNSIVDFGKNKIYNMQLKQPVNYHIIIIERSLLTFGNQSVKR